MKKVIISGHGNFATGLYSSVKIILGEQDFVTCLDCYVDKNQNVEKDIESLLNSFDANDEIICLTDLFGGSVNNAFMKIIGDRDISLISGTNLNILLNIILNADMDNKELIDTYLEESRQGLMDCKMQNKNIEEDEEF
ncbi:MAG: hypothetical protein Q4B23_04210 [Helcococcus sp.]|nr:hypothetical protein [Helcococcus sp.]